MERSKEPIRIQEIKAVIQIYVALHGEKRARYLVRNWAATYVFTPWAFEYLERWLEGEEQ